MSIFLECDNCISRPFGDVCSTCRNNKRAIDERDKIVLDLENLLFNYGHMKNPPCFICGYNGEGYFQPDKHLCAMRHHVLYGG